MATLLGQKINATYDSLLKTEDNDGITGSLKQLTDGVGQTTPLYLSTTEAKIGGNLEITGDLTVGGTTTYVNTDNVTVKDGLVLLANDNVADIIDIGLYGKYNDGTVKYTGLYRDATDGKFKIFDGLTTEPTTTVGGGNLADFAAAGGSYSGNLIVDGNYYSADGAISLTNGDIVTGGHIAINSGSPASSFSSNANQLIVGGADSGTNQGMTIASDSGATGNIFFADGITGDQQYRGLITYNHSSDTMYLGTSAANRLSITSSGLSVLTGGKIFVNGAGNNGYINSKGAVAAQVLSVDDSRLFRGLDSSVQEVFYVQGTGDVFASGQLIIDSIDASGSVSAFNVTASNAITSGTLNVADAIIHTGDTDTMIEFLANQIKTTTGGVLNINTTPTQTTFYQNVGIGRTPSYKLDVSSVSRFTDGFYLDQATAGTNAAIYLKDDQTLELEAFGTNGEIAFSVGSSISEAMRIDSSGNVGIGVIPSASSLNPSLELKGGGSLFAYGDGLYMNANLYYDGGWKARNTGGSSSILAANYMAFYVNPSVSAGAAATATERMRIDSSGNVGIGTTSPSSKLHVAGNSSVRNTIVNNVIIDGGTSVPNPYDGFGFGITFSGRDYGNATRNYAYISSVMEDQSSSAGGGDAGFKAGLRFYTNKGGSSTANPTEAMRIDSSGNVGINCNPNAKLEVKGNLKIQRSSNIETSEITMESGNFDVKSAPYGYPIVFHTGTGGSSSERMRITSGGYLKASNTGSYFGATNPYHENRNNYAGEFITYFTNDAASTPSGLYIRYTSSDPNDSTNYFIYARSTGGVKFTVSSNGDVKNANNSYGAVSDIKLKENITDASPKLDDLMQVKVRNYNLIGDDKKQLGVVAQELEEVFPSMIDESTDFEEREVELKDEDGNIVYKTEQVLVSEAVEAVIEIVEHEAIAEELDEDGNVIVEAQDAWTEEVIVTPAQEAVYETVVTDVPEMTTEKFDLGTTTKSVKYSVFVPMLIKAVQELKAELDALKGA